jgi:hypothetical protein
VTQQEPGGSEILVAVVLVYHYTPITKIFSLKPKRDRLWNARASARGFASNINIIYSPPVAEA